MALLDEAMRTQGCADIFATDCQLVLRMQPTKPSAPAEELFKPEAWPPTGPSTAERLNGIEWRGFIRFDYAASQVRYRADGSWRQSWTE